MNFEKYKILIIANLSLIALSLPSAIGGNDYMIIIAFSTIIILLGVLFFLSQENPGVKTEFKITIKRKIIGIDVSAILLAFTIAPMIGLFVLEALKC